MDKSPADRLTDLVRRCNRGDLGRSRPEDVVLILSWVHGSTTDEPVFPDDDLRLLRMAVAALAFYRAVHRIGEEEPGEVSEEERSILEGERN